MLGETERVTDLYYYLNDHNSNLENITNSMVNPILKSCL